VAVESDTKLAELAGERITKLGLDNVVIEIGPVNAGWGDQAPYDVIIVNGACETISDELLLQLAEGGRLVCTICDSNGVGAATLFAKVGGMVSTRALFGANVPKLPEFELEEGFSF
jgi:protein-L-isoaspartate(D-aspartate) O-methyltransferase